MNEYGSERMLAVQSPMIPVVAEMIRRSPGTISLGQGVVHYGPPPEALEHLSLCLGDAANHKYGPVQGLPALVAALESKLCAENNIHVERGSAIVVTAGGNMAFQTAVQSITDPGDEIILLTPYYFNHEMAVTIAGCRPVLVPTDANYQPDLVAIAAAITEKTRAVVTTSPNNPTGAVYPEATLRAINNLCRQQNIYHINDEAYEDFVYEDARHFSPGSLPDAAAHTISLYSLSKAYGFASWRIGYMVLPEKLLTSVKKILDTVLICPPVISQYAALGALKAGSAYCREKLKSIAEVRRTVLSALQEIPSLCTVPPSDGAFYFLLKINTDLNDMQLVQRLVEEYKVAALPGSTFGLREGCYLRIAYGSLEKETVTEGIGRLVQGLKALVGSYEGE
jgi:aspartate/methionine/tyrosine aminotransferase